MVLYDIINLTPTTIVKKETANAIPVNSSQRTERKTLTISNDSITETEPNVNTNDKKSYAMPKTDQEYLTAVEKGDIETDQKMVDEAAKKAGYDSLLLFHGTQSFGFTEFDLSKMIVVIGFTSFAIEKGSRPADVLSVVTEKSATTSTNSITKTESNVNTKDKKVLHCRKQDGEGNELSDEHHEVFKQSKATDSKTHYRLSSNPYA